ncbi:MAG: response regulator [Armatimonadetes bacterium]|nr:response regulator [Armatimonadota bacterium]
MNRILFIDDEERVLEGLRRLVRMHCPEWDVSYATNVDDALIVIAGGLDAVVTDLNMPGKDGLDLLRSVRLDPATSHLPCLVLTGNGDLQAKKEALERGATDFLDKPIDFWELRVRLENAIELKRYQDLVAAQNDLLDARVKETTRDLELSRKNVLLRLALAAEWRDEDTGAHILRVGLLSRLLAEELGFDQEAQERILLASPLHDVGKISLPDRILFKKGPIDPEEREAMKEHCAAGFQILAGDRGGIFSFLGIDEKADNQNELLHCAALIAMTHHERWDGTGYPSGLKGEAIPIEGRIVSVADVYDALRSKRSYKDEFPVERAAEIVQNGAGSHFDPKVVDAMLRRIDDAERALDRFRDPAVSRAVAA